MKSSSVPLKISIFIAFIGSIVTLIQIVLISSNYEGICFNEGCKLVDSLTTVSPILINFAGLIFFQLIMWGAWFARKGGSGWVTLLKTLLLAGMAVEGVLIAFQYSVAKSYCSYCLIIFGIVVLLNLFAGFRQSLFAATVFTAVLLAFTGLKISSSSKSQSLSLEKGAFAYIENSTFDKQLYLFFSSSCPYCEVVMEGITQQNKCSIRFNPISIVESIPVREAKRTESYLPEVNRGFLQQLGIDEIPVLAIEEPGQLVVIKGEKRIQEYFNSGCLEIEQVAQPQIEQSLSGNQTLDFLQPSQGDDACSISVDCEDLQSGVVPQQIQ